MSDETKCVILFVSRLLTDLGVGLYEQYYIGGKLGSVVTSYNENKSTNTLHNLSDELYNCIKPHIETTAITTGEEFGFLIIYFTVLTAILMFIVVILFGLLRHTNKVALIGIIIGFCICYVVIGILLISHNFNIILNNISDAENQIMLCINKAITDLEQVVQTDDDAFYKAICAYQSA